MKTPKNAPIGLTKDTGFQVGVRKTFPVSPDAAWDFLFSTKGLTLWLGTENISNWNIETAFLTNNGLSVHVTTFKDGSHLRMKWKPNNWENTSMLQIRLIPNKTKTTISFHQDKLESSKQREIMKVHWKVVLESFADNL